MSSTGGDYFGSSAAISAAAAAALTETLLAAMAGKPIISKQFNPMDLNIPTTTMVDKTIQHGIWNTIVPDGLQLLIAQREKHIRELQNIQQQQNQQKRENSDQTSQQSGGDNNSQNGFVYVDVSESSSPASSIQSSSSTTSSILSQPPASNLSTTSSQSSFSSSQEFSTDKAIKDALNLTMSRAPRAYRWASTMEKESTKYKAKRERNNEAVRRSREKNKFKKLLEDEKYDQLRNRYLALLDGIKNNCKCACANQLVAEFEDEDES